MNRSARALTGTRPTSAVAALLALLLSSHVTPAWASSWAVGLSGGNDGQAASGTLSTPANVVSSCGAGKTVVVTWAAVTGALSYTIQRSTTSATSGFTATATGITGTTWTSGLLTNGNTYWFQVLAVAGSWTGGVSPATAQRTISGGACS